MEGLTSGDESRLLMGKKKALKQERCSLRKKGRRLRRILRISSRKKAKDLE